MSSAAERIMPTAGEVIDRMREALCLKSDGELASYLGIAKTTASSWRRRNSIPYAECVELAMRGAARLEWLITGEGDKIDARLAYQPTIDPVVLSGIIDVVDGYLERYPAEVRHLFNRGQMIVFMYERYRDTLSHLMHSGGFDYDEASRILDEAMRRAQDPGSRFPGGPATDTN
jgi:hypothetical protein